MAMAGRLLFSTVIDRLNQRLASAISFVSQAMALAIIIHSRNEVLLIAACALFGFSVGNLITLPALIIQREFDPRSFGVLVSLLTATNQITYAFGPGVIGLLRDVSGSYTLPFYGCIGLELVAAMLIMVRRKNGPIGDPETSLRAIGSAQAPPDDSEAIHSEPSKNATGLLRRKCSSQ
jgi:cyanate permease